MLRMVRAAFVSVLIGDEEEAVEPRRPDRDGHPYRGVPSIGRAFAAELGDPEHDPWGGPDEAEYGSSQHAWDGISGRLVHIDEEGNPVIYRDELNAA